MSVVAHPRMEAEVQRLRILYELVTALSSSSGMQEVYDAALTSLLQATSADRAAFLLFDDDGVIRFKASRGLSEEYQAAVTGHSPWRRGERDAKPLVIPDVWCDESLADYREIFKRENIRAVVFVPLALDAGVLGKFMLYYAEPHTALPGELEMAQVIAAHIALTTERKRAELARMHTERRLEAILDFSTTIIYLKDLQGRYQLINRRHEELFHFTKSGIVGRTDFDLFPRAIAERLVQNDRQMLATGEPLAVEEYIPQDDGLHSYLSVKFPVPGADGTITGVCAISTDITERNRLEAASQHLAAVIESSEDAIVSKDLNGIVTSWNKGAERTFGYAASEMVGQPVAILAAPDRIDEMPDILSRIRQGKRVEHYETRRRRKDGRIIDVALTVSPVRDSSGRIIGASKIARDITERKHVEQERAVLLSREREARRTAELLNQVAPRLAAQLDLEKLVQEVTDTATAVLGAEFGSFFHNAVNENGESPVLYSVSGVPPEALGEFPILRNTALFGPAFRSDDIVRCDDVRLDPQYDQNPRHCGIREGSLPVRSYLAAPVKSHSGEVLGRLFFGHSLPGKFTQSHEEILIGIAAQASIAMDNARLFQQTQLVQTELKRSNDGLRRANRDLEVFAYSASHDLQEPLRTIAISAELIQRSWGRQLTGDDAEFLDNVLTASRRMSALIEDLLTYMRASKSEEGPPPSVDSGHVLSNVLGSLRQNLQDSGATVTTGDLPIVAMHAGRLGQLFQNLISNALKYRGKGPPCVHISAEARDGWCTFAIVDNGIGIEPQFAEQIFGLFKRLHSRSEYPGSGIGLAICQRAVEQYGGRIWLEQSTPGQGSTFCFSVPAGSRS